MDHDEILRRIIIGDYPKNTVDKMENFLQFAIIDDITEKETHGDKPSRSWSLQVIRSLRGIGN